MSARSRPRAEPARWALDGRSAGILLHVTSLPGPHGNGDLGSEARRFIAFLAEAGQRWWQTLPVNPTGPGNSPYSGVSAFAGSPLLISLEDLVEDGLLRPAEAAFRIAPRRTDYDQASRRRAQALRLAFERQRRSGRRAAQELEQFRTEAAFWLPDYALYMALRRAMKDKRWPEWPRELAQRDRAALRRARSELASEIEYFEFEQLLFRRQWNRLRQHGRSRGVGLIGDAPLFIAHESADVWSHARLFTLDARGEATHVAGVPPDYFSKTGQRWGNPLYRWAHSRRTGHVFWIERFRTLLHHFDVIRLDHFIGFSRYWSVPAREKTAEHGSFRAGPGRALFEAARERLGATPFIAEDLGEVTPAVRRLRDELALPGMRVLQFAFGTDVQANDFLPHRYLRRCVAYTGTHDNDTFVGWLQDRGGAGAPRSVRQAAKERRAAIEYLAGPGARKLDPAAHWAAIRAVYASVADTVILPLQDALGLGSESRMNVPGSAVGNWEWRLGSLRSASPLAARLRAFSSTYGRMP